jgi:hypothetical protein
LSERRLRLELRPSRRLAAAILALHGAAAAGALLSLPAAPAAAIGAALLALGALSARRRALLASASSVRVLELEGTKARVTLASGAALSAEAAPRRYVGRTMVCVTLRRPVRRTLLVTRDMLGPESFRRLRVWALWGRLPAVAARQLAA